MFFRKSQQNEELGDAELLSRFRVSRDSRFVSALFERYVLQIYAICKSYLREEEETRDAAMEMFEYLLVELTKYEIENFRHWLGRATKNFCLMRLRKMNSSFKKEAEFRLS